MKNHFSATMKFEHGEIKIEGTIIFVLAMINEQEKRGGWKSTEQSDELKQAIAAAREKQIV